MTGSHRIPKKWRRRSRRSGEMPTKLNLEQLESRLMLSVDVLTWHNDLTRQGLNNAETVLTPSNVNSTTFGKLFSYSVQGQVYAQPLYVSNLAIPGQGTHNVVFVATENDDVYAFDADSNAGPNGGLLWHTSLIATLGATAAATPNPYFGTRYNGGMYTDVTPQVGITSTPVIDLATGTIYVDAFTNDVPGQNAYSHHIWALDITTGQQKTAPVLVAASIQGNGVASVGGTITFKASQQMQRAALTLLNGTLYVAYAGYADTDPYHGWILGFNASSLQLVSVFNTTPNLSTSPPDPNHQGEAGIWSAGASFTTDGTHLYIITGNGDFQTSVGDYGDTFMELTPDGSNQPANKNGHGLSVTDYFTPFNQSMLAQGDTDLGSGGTMFLPDQPGPHPHLLIGAGKQGIIYVIDRDNMGQFSSTTDNVVQKVTTNKFFTSSPAYFNNTIYYHGFTDFLKAYKLTNGALSAVPIGTGGASYAFPGATPSISSYGNSANGIVWEVGYSTSHAVLRAYNAIPNVSTLTELFNSNTNVARDQLGAGAKFVVPTIANGHVYVGGTGYVSVFGLLSPTLTAPNVPTNFTATAPATLALQVQLSWTDNSNNENAFKIERSTDGVHFTQIDVASVNATSYTDTTVSSGVTYTYRISATNQIGDSSYTAAASATPIALSAPVALYHFDEGTGTTANDAIGFNTGTLVGATKPAWAPGYTGGAALSFSGTGAPNQSNQSAVQLLSSLAPTLGSTSTLDFWILTQQTGSDTHSLAPAVTGVDQASSTNDIDWGTINASGRIGIYVGDAGGVYSTNPINNLQWHNVALTRDATTGIVQIYVDGVLNASSGFDTGAKSSAFTLIGGLSVRNSSGTLTGGNYFNGLLDEVRIYNRVLTPAEIADIGQIPAMPTGLMASTVPDSGSILQLTWTNNSSFAQNIEVQRKTGAGGIYQQIALLNGTETSYTDSGLDAGTQYFYRVRAIDLAGNSPFSTEASGIPPRPEILGRYTFYDNSSWDVEETSAHIANGLAIATDKAPLLPGQTATFQNYTSYSKGTNGVMIDLMNFEGVITPDDFVLRVGNSSDVENWQLAPAPDEVSQRPGIGVDGSTRLEITWDNNEIQNEWLQVTLLANDNTKLASDDVFYFGNAIGDSGDSATTAAVDSADELAARSNLTAVDAALIDNPYDFNRDKVVDQLDELVTRSHRSGLFPLQLISVPAVSGSGSIVTAPVIQNDLPLSPPANGSAAPLVLIDQGSVAVPLQSALAKEKVKPVVFLNAIASPSRHSKSTDEVFAALGHSATNSQAAIELLTLVANSHDTVKSHSTETKASGANASDSVARIKAYLETGLLTDSPVTNVKAGPTAPTMPYPPKKTRR